VFSLSLFVSFSRLNWPRSFSFSFWVEGADHIQENKKKTIFSIQKRYIETSPGRSISLLARVLRLLWVVIVVVLLLSQIDETMGVCYAMGVEGKVFFCDGSDKVTRRSS
jgi:hypothetical protein